MKLTVIQLQKKKRGNTVGNNGIANLNVMCILNVDPISVGTRGWCIDGHRVYNHVIAIVKPYMELSTVLEGKPFDFHV